MNGPPPPLVQELAALGYALTHALYTEAKELLVKEGLSPRKAHLLGLLAKGVAVSYTHLTLPTKRIV